MRLSSSKIYICCLFCKSQEVNRSARLLVKMAVMRFQEKKETKETKNDCLYYAVINLDFLIVQTKFAQIWLWSAGVRGSPPSPISGITPADDEWGRGTPSPWTRCLSDWRLSSSDSCGGAEDCSYSDTVSLITTSSTGWSCCPWGWPRCPCVLGGMPRRGVLVWPPRLLVAWRGDLPRDRIRPRKDPLVPCPLIGWPLKKTITRR